MKTYQWSWLDSNGHGYVLHLVLASLRTEMHGRVPHHRAFVNELYFNKYVKNLEQFIVIICLYSQKIITYGIYSGSAKYRRSIPDPVHVEICLFWALLKCKIEKQSNWCKTKTLFWKESPPGYCLFFVFMVTRKYTCC